MKILSELRALKRQVAYLQVNQKEANGTFTCSGCPVTDVDPIQRISLLEMEVENLYGNLLDAQSKVIQGHENNY